MGHAILPRAVTWLTPALGFMQQKNPLFSDHQVCFEILENRSHGGCPFCIRNLHQKISIRSMF